MSARTAKELDKYAPSYQIGDTFIRQFESLADYVKCADEFGDEANGASRRDSQREFMGSADYWEASKLAHNGWREVPDVIDQITNAVTVRVIADREESTFTFVNDVSGAEVNMDHYLAGIPENMMEAVPVSVPRHGQLVRVLIPVGVLANVRKEEIQIRGAALVALIQSLAKVNYAVDLFAVKCGKSHGSAKYAHTVHVQHGDQVYSPDHIAYAFGHTTMPRRIGWAIMEAESEGFRKTFGAYDVGTPCGYGRSIEPTLEMLPAWAQDGNTIVLPRLTASDPDFRNVETATRWVERTIEELVEKNV